MRESAALGFGRRTLFPALALVLGLVYLDSIHALRGSALAYPGIIVGMVLVLACVDLGIEIVRGARGVSGTGDADRLANRSVDRRADAPPERSGVLAALRTHWRSVVLVGLLAAYVWLMQVLGFYTATGLFLLAGFALLRVPIRRALIVSVCCLPVMYVVFTILFDISTLPKGLLG